VLGDLSKKLLSCNTKVVTEKYTEVVNEKLLEKTLHKLPT
jgi:hypothetical protein